MMWSEGSAVVIDFGYLKRFVFGKLRERRRIKFQQSQAVAWNAVKEYQGMFRQFWDCGGV